MPYPKSVLDHYDTLSDPNVSLNREVLNVISSYNNPWDSLSELIQNSVDAINERHRNEPDPTFRGRIDITIDSTQFSLKVEDNGCGIPGGKMQDLLVPGGTLKTSGKTYGHKGLGFTYCAHISRKVVVETEDLNGAKDSWALEGAFEWTNDPSSSPRTRSGFEHSHREILGAGTTVELTLCPGQYETANANTAALETFFDWSDEPKLIEFVLRTRTAVGHLGALFGDSPSPPIDVQVNITNGGHKLNVDYQYFDLTSLPPMASQAYDEATDYFTNVYNNNAKSDKSHHGIHFVFSSQGGNPLKVGRHQGGITFKAYIYALGKDNLVKALESWDPRLGRGGEFRYLAIDTEVYLAIEGMPCGNPIDSWSRSGGFFDRFFCVVNAELKFGSALDSGRKTITPHYVNLFVDAVDSLVRDKSFFGNVSTFYEMAQQLTVSRSGTPKAGRPRALVQEWDQLPDLNSKRLLVHKEPKDELAIFVLFSQLAEIGILKGYIFRYVSSSAIYDAALGLEIDFRDPQQINSTINGGKNKFGVGSSLAQQAKNENQFPQYKWMEPTHGRDYLVCELKVQASALLDETQRRKSLKTLSEIEVLVCWEIDDEVANRFGAAVSRTTEAGRKFPGETHELSSQGQTISVIALKTLINELIQANAL